MTGVHRSHRKNPGKPKLYTIQTTLSNDWDTDIHTLSCLSLSRRFIPTIRGVNDGCVVNKRDETKSLARLQSCEFAIVATQRGSDHHQANLTVHIRTYILERSIDRLITALFNCNLTTTALGT